MSIASELTALNGYILGAYDEINTKGGTVPANKNMANLASAIGTISGGGGITFGDWVLSTGTIVPTETISANYTITLPTTTASGTVVSGAATAIFFLALELPPYATIADYYTSILRAMANYNVKRAGSGYTGDTYVSSFNTSGSITTNTTTSALKIEYLRASEIEVKFGCTSSRQLLAGCSYRWMSFVKSKETA